MAASAVPGQGTFPNLAAPADTVAGKAVMLANLQKALDIEGKGAGADSYKREVLKQASDWIDTVV